MHILAVQAAGCICQQVGANASMHACTFKCGPFSLQAHTQDDSILPIETNKRALELYYSIWNETS